MISNIKNIVFTIFLASISGAASAHSGGLNKGGCHNEMQGQFHCHKKFSSALTVTPKTKYNRDSWSHWSDFDNDCMNTRHEILLVQADGPVKRTSNDCSILTGTWNDPFSGNTFSLASDLDVDHIIPLKWASEHGGLKWPANKKERFANDPLNLLAVDDSLNQSKGAKGPTQWMPPNHAFRCEYLGLWQSVLSKYSGLKMTSKENRTFKKQLAACN